MEADVARRALSPSSCHKGRGGCRTWCRGGRVRRLSEGRAETDSSLAVHEDCVSQSGSGSRSDSTSAKVLGLEGRAANAVLHVDAVVNDRR